ncbi:hypothetical protein RhiJN_03820 [Ceratobasidium sp. AG-Ba]|nr:hypothetical protein RhiJN_03820 [Ceratobasidium sp. AG-Ba]QRW04714.1 hypothetical protein RhiLY_03713 [Ceratobasidium sp. AG-Ba]
MPAADPEDQREAREFERSLRKDVAAGRAYRATLEWFEAQPKRVRRSLRLIVETAKRDKAELERRMADEDPRQQCRLRTPLQISPPLQYNVEPNPWAAHCPETRQIECTAVTRPVQLPPRDLSCLKSDGNPWGGIGRRKKRFRAFCAIGRAYIRHQSITSPSPAPVFTLESSSFWPTRPATPLGLREALYTFDGLLQIANGPATYGLNTPAAPQPKPRPATLPPFEQMDVQPSDLKVLGRVINPCVAYVVARGRQVLGARGVDLLRDAAVDIACAESVIPGALGQLARLLFPNGLHDLDSGSEPHVALLYFFYGWYDLMS